MVGDPEDAHGVGQFADPVFAQPVVAVAGQVGEVRVEHLALLAEGAGDQGDADALTGVAGHRQPGLDHFVVGVGVHEKQPEVGAVHPVSLRRFPATRCMWLQSPTAVSGLSGQQPKEFFVPDVPPAPLVPPAAGRPMTDRTS